MIVCDRYSFGKEHWENLRQGGSSEEAASEKSFLREKPNLGLEGCVGVHHADWRSGGDGFQGGENSVIQEDQSGGLCREVELRLPTQRVGQGSQPLLGGGGRCRTMGV